MSSVFLILYRTGFLIYVSFFPGTSFSRRQLHSLRRLITYFSWKFYLFAFFPCLLPSDTGHVFSWRARLHSSFPGLLFGLWAPVLLHDSCRETQLCFPLSSTHCQDLWVTRPEFPCPLKGLSMCWKVQFASVSLCRYNQLRRFWMRSFISCPCSPRRCTGQISSKLKAMRVRSYPLPLDVVHLWTLMTCCDSRGKGKGDQSKN